MKKIICATCGTQAEPIRQTRGSIWIELALWLLFLVPGLLYSLWRLTTKHTVCRQCGSTEIVPVTSPRGAALSQQYAVSTSPESQAKPKKKRSEMTMQELLDNNMD
jgi:ribosomal protein L37E